jgi:hypothetical protein
MKLNREKLYDLYYEFLEDNDIEGHLQNVSYNVLDTICFIIEKYPETIDIHPNYTSNSSL